MGSYFKPLRRKLGAVTLVLACLSVVGWVRSLSMLDVLTFATSDRLWRLTIEEGELEITQYVRISGDPRLRENIGWKSASNVDSRGRKSRHGYIMSNLAIADTKSEFLGFAYSTKKWVTPALDVDQSYFVFPYWSVVMPLTLLSAWLLLSRRRTGQLKPVSEV